MQNNRRVIVIPKKTIGLVVVFVLFALLVWYGVLTRISRRSGGIAESGRSSTGGLMSAPSSVNIGGSVASKMMPDIFRGNQEVPVTDTREFLKTSYQASIKTRDVQGIVVSVKNIIKGNDGRIDNLSSSEKSGYVTFVVPKSKFEAFRLEMEGLTHKKLISESSSSQNLLREKRSIEEQRNDINGMIESLKQQKEALLSTHTQMVSAINRELQVIRAELSGVRKKIGETQDASELEALRSQESVLVARETAQKQKLAGENSNYAAQNTSLDNQIKNQNASLASVEKQDTSFTENIETVDGSVDVRWVSIWQMIKIFSPIAPELLIVILALIVWNILARLGYVPKFVVI